MEYRKRLIVADDYEPFARLCRDMLEPEYNVVALVRDGKELIEKAVLLCPDVVVLDLNMPGMNGFEASRWLRKQLPSTKLLFVTAAYAPEIASALLGNGAYGVFTKGEGLDIRRAVRALMGESVETAAVSCPN